MWGLWFGVEGFGLWFGSGDLLAFVAGEAQRGVWDSGFVVGNGPQPRPWPLILFGPWHPGRLLACVCVWYVLYRGSHACASQSSSSQPAPGHAAFPSPKGGT